MGTDVLKPIVWVVRTGDGLDCRKIDSVWGSEGLARKRITQMIAIEKKKMESVLLNNTGFLIPYELKLDIDAIPYKVDGEESHLPSCHGEPYQDNSFADWIHLDNH